MKILPCVLGGAEVAEGKISDEEVALYDDVIVDDVAGTTHDDVDDDEWGIDDVIGKHGDDIDEVAEDIAESGIDIVSGDDNVICDVCITGDVTGFDVLLGSEVVLWKASKEWAAFCISSSEEQPPRNELSWTLDGDDGLALDGDVGWTLAGDSG